MQIINGYNHSHVAKASSSCCYNTTVSAFLTVYFQAAKYYPDMSFVSCSKLNDTELSVTGAYKVTIRIL